MKKGKKYLRLIALSLVMCLVFPGYVSAAGSNTKGIDVSQYNGVVDWAAVRQQGYRFAMIKTGNGEAPANFNDDVDPQFEANYYGAGSAGLKRGAYHFCCTRTPAGAKREAEYLVKILNGRKLEYPVVYDMEQDGTFVGGKKNTTAIAKAFCDVIKKAGYTPMIYSSDAHLIKDFDWSKLGGIKVWVASYGVSRPEFTGVYDMWQYKDNGKVSGANTNNGMGTCDLNYSFMEAEKISFQTSAVNLGVKESFTLKTTIKPAGCTDSIRYLSSDKSVATVSKSGKVKAVRPGTAVITVKSGSGKTASCKINVKKAPSKVKISKSKISLKKGKTFQMKPILSSKEYSNQMK